MDIIRKQTVKRSDPEKHPGGTPLAKSPRIDLGTEVIPKERYTSEEFMELEWEKIWTKTWLLGCREDQIPEPGDFICTNIGRESVLIVRQKNYEIKAFHNVCMHRGNRLADEGLWHAESFVCGYHGWEYDSDGTFVDIPDLNTFQQGKPPCGGLAELPCDT